eukprot:12440232-Ditylum_brightwellii.AAC.1
MTSRYPAKLVVSRKECLKSSSACHLYKSIGPDVQQHYKDGVENQERAFERTKMASQDEILKNLSRRKTADQIHEINKYTMSLIMPRRANQAEANE